MFIVQVRGSGRIVVLFGRRIPRRAPLLLVSENPLPGVHGSYPERGVRKPRCGSVIDRDMGSTKLAVVFCWKDVWAVHRGRFYAYALRSLLDVRLKRGGGCVLWKIANVENGFLSRRFLFGDEFSQLVVAFVEGKPACRGQLLLGTRAWSLFLAFLVFDLFVRSECHTVRTRGWGRSWGRRRRFARNTCVSYTVSYTCWRAIAYFISSFAHRLHSHAFPAPLFTLFFPYYLVLRAVFISQLPTLALFAKNYSPFLNMFRSIHFAII